MGMSTKPKDKHCILQRNDVGRCWKLQGKEGSSEETYRLPLVGLSWRWKCLLVKFQCSWSLIMRYIWQNSKIHEPWKCNYATNEPIKSFTSKIFPGLYPNWWSAIVYQFPMFFIIPIMLQSPELSRKSKSMNLQWWYTLMITLLQTLKNSFSFFYSKWCSSLNWHILIMAQSQLFRTEY